MLSNFPSIPPTAGSKKTVPDFDNNVTNTIVDKEWKYDTHSVENLKYFEEMNVDKEDEGYDFLAFVTKEQCIEVNDG